MNILNILIYIVIGIVVIILSYLLTKEITFLTNNKKRYLDYLNKIKENFKKYDESYMSDIIVFKKIADFQRLYSSSPITEASDITTIRDDIMKKLDILINNMKKEQNKNLMLNMILNAVFYLLGLITSLLL